jgi:integrase
LKVVLRGIRRTIGTARAGKAPATADVLMQMVALCPDNMIGRRDRALLALGFAGAFRRSELCALEVADLVEVADGLRVVIRKSKTDQEGQGQEVAIPRGYKLRPVEAVQTWLAAAEISSGPVCRGARREGIRRGAGGRQRGADREAIRRGGGPRSSGLQWALAACRLPDFGRRIRRIGVQAR